MARRKPLTPFRRWHDANGRPAPKAIAATLGCTEGSIRHYLAGRAIPKPNTIRGLKTLTGLPSDAFLFPFEASA